jgi:hypothetical protein
MEWFIGVRMGMVILIQVKMVTRKSASRATGSSMPFPFYLTYKESHKEEHCFFVDL